MSAVFWGLGVSRSIRLLVGRPHSVKHARWKHICNFTRPVTFSRNLGNLGYARSRRPIAATGRTVWTKRWSSGVAFALTIFGYKLFGKDEEEDKEEAAVIYTLKRAKLAQMKEEFESSEELFHQALEMVRNYEETKIWAEDRTRQARIYIYDCLANLALARSQLDVAETLFKETMRGLIQNGMELVDNAIIEISLKLATIYAMQGKILDAEIGYKYCIEIQERKVLTGSGFEDMIPKKGVEEKGDTEVNPNDEVTNTKALFGMCMDAYSRFLVVQKRYLEAENFLRKALDVAQHVFESDHPQIAVMYSDLGAIACLREEYGRAKEHISKAIEVAKKTDSNDLSAFYCNLGNVLLKTNDYDQAIGAFEQAARLAKAIEDKDAEQTANECLRKARKLREQTK